MLNRIRNRESVPMVLLVCLVCASLAVIIWRLVFDFSADALGLISGASAPGRTMTIGNSVAESVSWSPNGHYLAAGYLLDTSARIWDVQTGHAIEELDSFRGAVTLVS